MICERMKRRQSRMVLRRASPEALENCGIAIAARIPRITTTIRISISVKPAPLAECGRLFAYLFMAFPILFPWAENFTSLSPIHSARADVALANPRDATSAHSADDDSAGRLSQLRG